MKKTIIFLIILSFISTPVFAIELDAPIIPNEPTISTDFGVPGYPDSLVIQCSTIAVGNCDSFFASNLPPVYTILSYNFLDDTNVFSLWCGDVDLSILNVEFYSGSEYTKSQTHSNAQFHCTEPITGYPSFSGNNQNLIIQYVPYDTRESEQFQKYTNENSGANFYLDKSISYGDVFVLLFFIFFFCALIFKLLWNFNWKDEKAKL